MLRVRDRDRKRVTEDGARLRESDAVLPPIRRIFSSIPLESEPRHLLSSLASEELTAQSATLREIMAELAGIVDRRERVAG